MIKNSEEELFFEGDEEPEEAIAKEEFVPREEMDEVPEDLPEDQPGSYQQSETPAITTASRQCDNCGSTSMRVVSKQDIGVRVYCNDCGGHATVSSAPLVVPTPMTGGRGFSKRTILQPDLDVAFDDLDGDAGAFKRQGGPAKGKK